MSSNSDSILAGTSWLPPVNENCPICHNLDVAVLGRRHGLTIRIHANEEFRRSAAESCLGCKVIRDGVMNVAGSTEKFSEVQLLYTKEYRSSSSQFGLTAHLYCPSLDDWDTHIPRPLWFNGDQRYKSLDLMFYTLPGMYKIYLI